MAMLILARSIRSFLPPRIECLSTISIYLSKLCLDKFRPSSVCASHINTHSDYSVHTLTTRSLSANFSTKMSSTSDDSKAVPTAAAVHELKLPVKKLSEHAILPVRGSEHAAGYDLSSAYDVTIPAQGKAIAKTDLAMVIPNGCYGRVAPRSGLSWKHHIDVGAGVIDADYRGNVGVVLFNHAQTDYQSMYRFVSPAYISNGICAV
jgi:deoxyuridine 5'-triphosphate nucleotidohydrolase